MRVRARRDRATPARRTSFFRDLVVIVVVAILASFLIKTYLVRSFYIPSESMEQTLDVNDRVLVDELVPGVIPLHRGDVVVFTDPGDWLPKTTVAPQAPIAAAVEWLRSLVGISTADTNNHLIKRVIGLPGDHVTCCDARGRMSVNGTPLNEPYAVVPAGNTAVSSTPFTITVPAGKLWVMGDNRYHSADSRELGHGAVPIKDVVGRAFIITWPLGRWSVLSDQPKTFDGVKAPAG